MKELRAFIVILVVILTVVLIVILLILIIVLLIFAVLLTIVLIIILLIAVLVVLIHSYQLLSLIIVSEKNAYIQCFSRFLNAFLTVPSKASAPETIRNIPNAVLTRRGAVFAPRIQPNIAPNAPADAKTPAIFHFIRPFFAWNGSEQREAMIKKTRFIP